MTNGIMLPSYSYQSGNSFNIVNDNITTLSLFAEVDVYISKEFKFGGTIEYNNLETDTQAKAWYTPSLKASAFANYNAKKWYVGADLYFVGEQFDLVQNFGDITATVKTLDPYVDLNFNGGYVFTDRLTAFGRVNNVLGINYDKYTNYKVQGIQVLAGIIYKFDF